MALSIVKETIELTSLQTDTDGNAYATKRINLQEGKVHSLLQVDMFRDRLMTFPVDGGQSVYMEMVVSAYPSIPTDMPFSFGKPNSYPAAGDDSVLFKAHEQMFNQEQITSLRADREQFPSKQIAASNKSVFYSDHLYLNFTIKGAPNTTYENIAYSFLLVLDNKGTTALTHSIGVLAESHDAMCALIMSNGCMTNISDLRGNTFPMWRYGGNVSEQMVSPLAAGSFFLEVSTLDNELMQTAAQVRSTIADARSMAPFDEPQGNRFPSGILMGLNQGLVSGAVRDNWPPQKYYNNGNTRMF